MLHQLDIQRRIREERNLIKLEGERLYMLNGMVIDNNRLHDLYAFDFCD